MNATGVTANSSSKSILVYPNPNNGQFTLELNINAQVQIIDALGRVVYDEKLSSGKQIINIHEEKNGVYFMKIITDTNQHTERIIINK